MQEKLDLSELLKSPETLKKTLKVNPDLIHTQDTNGKTLLHHAADLISSCGSRESLQILKILFSYTNNSNISLKDKKGNTPIDIAADNCCRWETGLSSNLVMFIEFLKEAVKNQYNFTALNGDGMSVLQVIVMSYWSPKNLDIICKTMLENVPDPGLDVLSSCGKSALCFSLNHIDCKMYYNIAISLLNAGASPEIFGSTKSNDPFIIIEKKLEEVSMKLNESKVSDHHSRFIKSLCEGNIRMLNILNELKQKMEALKSSTIVRKNTIIISILGESKNSLFHTLPNEIKSKIVSATRNPVVQTEEEADEISNNINAGVRA